MIRTTGTDAIAMTLGDWVRSFVPSRAQLALIHAQVEPPCLPWRQRAYRLTAGVTFSVSIVLALLTGLLVGTPCVAQEDLAALAQSPAWARLLVLEPDGAGVKSAIHSPAFFLAAEGATYPEAELRATLTAMRAPVSGDPDTHAKCRFPARRLWLRAQLPALSDDLAEIDCPAFSAWAGGREIESISVVFASGYLGNPASYYGHLFLKFNPPPSPGRARLLDVTLNFGAIMPHQDDPVRYIVKGIFGGYEGGFSPIEFYFHAANYGENELRDLWEYRLNLPAKATRLIVAHAWEVTQKQYTYYFFRRNCAYRVAELLQVADGLTLIPRNRPWVIPQAVLQGLAEGQINGKPLVAEKRYHPSRQSRLYARSSALDDEGRAWVGKLIAHDSAFSDQAFQEQPLGQRQAVIDTVLDYHQFRLERDPTRGSKKPSPDYLAALAARLNLPPGGSTLPGPLPDQSPEQGRAPSWLQLGVAQRAGQAMGYTLRVRPAYYDTLDAGAAHLKNGALAMGDLRIEGRGDRWRLSHFDVIAIDSMNPAVTGLPGDRGIGWKMKFGMRQERLCDDCRVTRLEGDIGMGRPLPGTALYAALYAGGALQHGSQFAGPLFARVGGMLLYRPNAVLGVRVDHVEQSPLHAARAHARATSVEARHALGRAQDLRLRWDRDGTQRMSLGLGFYW